MKYDFLLVGAGLFNAVLAERISATGKTCLVLEKRNHIGGNIYTEDQSGIVAHKYGAHIFHTSSKPIWNYVNCFATFNRFTNNPLANYRGRIFHLPFNMNTFHEIWPDVITPDDARKKIAEQTTEMRGIVPRNLEEQAISLAGRDIYELLIKGYTEKQWGRSCKDLPPEIIKRLPLRFIYDNNYFDDLYQGIPLGGYTHMIKEMLSGAEIQLNTDYLESRSYFNSLARQVIYTGTIDGYFDYCCGELNYRSLKFETEQLSVQNYQGNAVINYTDAETRYTRIIEHKHFEPENKTAIESNVSIITHEYPADWKPGDEPYYPVNDETNKTLYKKYTELAQKENIIFGGRLGMYQYFDMDDTVDAALKLADKIL